MSSFSEVDSVYQVAFFKKLDEKAKSFGKGSSYAVVIGVGGDDDDEEDDEVDEENEDTEKVYSKADLR